LAAVPSIGRAARVEGGLAPEADLTRALYEQYANQIFRYCLHQLGSREEAEDAVQSTFLNAFRGIKRGVVPELESAWLFKIAHNVCLSRRRTSWRRGRIESPTDFDVVEELTPAPARRSDELIGLQEVLERMPENQRRAILLREWQGLSYREIADELELSQAAVETLIFRARRALANGLEQPPETKRRIVRGTDLGNFLAGLKSLLLGGGAAVKIAATVAVVSATTVVAASPVQQHRSSSHAAPARAVLKPAPPATSQRSTGNSPIVAGPAAPFPAKSGGHRRPKVQRSAAVAFAQINGAPTPDPSTIAAPPEPAAAAPTESAPTPATPAPSGPAASAPAASEPAAAQPAAAQPAAQSTTPVSDKTTTSAKATKSDTSATASTQSGTTQSSATQSNTTQSSTTQSSATQSGATQSNTTQSGATQSSTTQSSQGSSSTGGTADSTSSTSDQRGSSSGGTTTTTPVPVNVKTVTTPITISAPVQTIQTTPMPPVTTTPTTPAAPVSTQTTTGQSSSSPSATVPKAVTPVATTPSTPATTTASTPAPTAKPTPIAPPVQIVTLPAPSSPTVSLSSGSTSIGKAKTTAGNNN
jgi:RNA polymerase sigma factor (sigma-70 family)